MTTAGIYFDGDMAFAIHARQPRDDRGEQEIVRDHDLVKRNAIPSGSFNPTERAGTMGNPEFSLSKGRKRRTAMRERRPRST